MEPGSESSEGQSERSQSAVPHRTTGRWKEPERGRQPATERSEVIGPRDNPSRRGGLGGLLERASTLKEQRPVRSSEASSAMPEPPGRTAGPGPTKSRGANCRVDETSRVAQQVTTKVAGNQHGLLKLLRSPQLRELLKAHEVQFCPCLSWGFFE